MISPWGVDHGDEISKKAPGQYSRDYKPTSGEAVANYALSPFYGAARSVKGRKARNAGRIIVRGAAESAAGSAIGGAVGGAVGAVSRNPQAGKVTGSGVGQILGTAGAVHGGYAAYRNAGRRGELKELRAGSSWRSKKD